MVQSVQFLYIQLAEMCPLTNMHSALPGQHSRTSIYAKKIPATKEQIFFKHLYVAFFVRDTKTSENNDNPDHYNQHTQTTSSTTTTYVCAQIEMRVGRR